MRVDGPLSTDEHLISVTVETSPANTTFSTGSRVFEMACENASILCYVKCPVLAAR